MLCPTPLLTIGINVISRDHSVMSEWIKRKSNHAKDPLPAAMELQTDVPIRRSNDTVARAGSIIVARSRDVVLASGRTYFPIEDCVLQNFMPSGKRWR